MSHFEMTGETCEYRGRTLRRIRALKFLRHCGVLPGVLGGWVERKENLRDHAWVADNAKVYGDALVSDEALVSDFAEVYESAEVGSRARISGKAKVYGNAVVAANVTDTAHVFGNAVTLECTIAGSAKIFENARVTGASWVGDQARLFGCATAQQKARIGGFASVFENASVVDQAWVSGMAQVFGNAQVAGQAWLLDHAQVFENSRVFDFAQVGSCARTYGHAWVFGNSVIDCGAQVFGYAQVCGDSRIEEFCRVSGSTRMGECADMVIPEFLSQEMLDNRAAREFAKGTFSFDVNTQCFSGGYESTLYFDHVGPNTYREVLRYCDGEEIEPESGAEMYFTGSPRQLKAAVLAHHSHAGGFMGYPVEFDKSFITLFVGDLEVP